MYLNLPEQPSQLEETHRKDREVFEEKLRNLQQTCERLEKEGREARESLVESSEKWNLEKEAVCGNVLLLLLLFYNLLLLHSSVYPSIT